MQPFATARRSGDNAAGRLERAALALVADGITTELQATVVHQRFATTVAGYAISSITATLLSLQWPLWGGLFAGAVMLGGVTDLAGGRSWVRRLIPRRGHRNVLAWLQDKAPDPSPGPWPGQTAETTTPKQILLLIPDHPSHRTISGGTGIGAVFGLASLLAILAAPALDPPVAATVLAVTAGSLLITALAAIAIDRRPAAPRSARGVAAARSILAALDPALPSRVGIVVVGSMEPWFDGVEVLLRARQRRHPASSTRVLIWHPGSGPLQRVERDGVFGRPSPAVMAHALHPLPIARRRWWHPPRTGALRARRLGWTAAGLVGGDDNGPTVDALVRLIQDLSEST